MTEEQDPVKEAVEEKKRKDEDAKKPRIYCPVCSQKIPPELKKRGIGFCPTHVPWPQNDPQG